MTSAVGPLSTLGSTEPTGHGARVVGRRRRGPPSGISGRLWQRYRRNHVAVAALVVLTVVVLFVAAADVVAAASGFAVDEGDLRRQLAPPLTDGHLLGTDLNGRDVLVRLAYGGRTSLLVAGLAALATLGVGGAVG